jgi:hypothetical protein
MSTKKALEQIFSKLAGTTKWQIDFFREIFNLIYSIQGRFNFQNLCRYSELNESTFRRNFQKFFDWLDFNLQIIKMAGVNLEDEVIAAMDCSFVTKSGKKTFGLDRFWSGCMGRTVTGLEIGLVSLVDVATRKAWALDVVQTPSGLSQKENDTTQTRIDFYIKQIQKCKDKLLGIKYFVGDGFYAKTKAFKAMADMDKKFITKLRPDANLRYLFKGKHKKGKGRKKTYAGKVDFRDLSPWKYIGNIEPHIEVYSVIANSPRFGINLKIVMLLNTKKDKHILLACTGLDLGTLKIIDYYRLRFQIEFLFRDAKQFTGLNHCQARSKEKLNFHFNLSLAAINMANLKMKLNPTIISMNTFKRLAYNTRFVSFLFKQLSSLSKVDINSPIVQQAIQLGRMWPKQRPKAA